MKFTTEDLERLTERVQFYSTEYMAEIPMRIHSRGTDDGHGLGGPPYHPQFEAWLKAGEPNERRVDDHRMRVTRAFRKIRQIAPREYFVLQLICAKRMDIVEVTRIMNERAEKGGHPERYTPMVVTVLLSSALDKAEKWY